MALWPIFCFARSLPTDLSMLVARRLENRPKRRRRYVSHLWGDVTRGQLQGSNFWRLDLEPWMLPADPRFRKDRRNIPSRRQ
jgi:hypothetical protein